MERIITSKEWLFTEDNYVWKLLNLEDNNNKYQEKKSN